MEFDPEDYWKKRGWRYSGQPNTDEYMYMADLVEKYTEHCAMLAEIGSGWGRVYKELHKCGLLTHRTLVMYDFVKSMRVVCAQETGWRPIKWDGKRIPSPDNHYHFVISASVLLHVPPESIKQVFSEHIRISKRYLYVATYTGRQKRLAEHCFWHDYEALFYKHQLTVIDSRPYLNRTNWLLEKA